MAKCFGFVCVCVPIIMSVLVGRQDRADAGHMVLASLVVCGAASHQRSYMGWRGLEQN